MDCWMWQYKGHIKPKRKIKRAALEGNKKSAIDFVDFLVLETKQSLLQTLFPLSASLYLIVIAYAEDLIETRVSFWTLFD